MAFALLNILKERKEKKPRAIKKDHFNETAKVVRHFIKVEEEEDRRVSPQHRLRVLKDALESARDEEEFDRIKKEKEELERAIHFNKTSDFVHEIPKNKESVIMENYRIEKEEATNDLIKVNQEVADLNNQLIKIKRELQMKKAESIKIKTMINEAKAVELAHQGKLKWDYYDDIMYGFRELNFSDLKDLRIRLLKGGN